MTDPVELSALTSALLFLALIAMALTAFLAAPGLAPVRRAFLEPPKAPPLMPNERLLLQLRPDSHLMRLAALAILGLTTALSLAPASVVVPVDFARLPAIAILGMLIYGEALDAWVLSGAAIICIANYLNIVARKPVKTAQN